MCQNTEGSINSVACYCFKISLTTAINQGAFHSKCLYPLNIYYVPVTIGQDDVILSYLRQYTKAYALFCFYLKRNPKKEIVETYFTETGV